MCTSRRSRRSPWTSSPAADRAGRPCSPWCALTTSGPGLPTRPARRCEVSITERPGLTGGADPAQRAGWGGHPPRMGFFTDTSVCIGCKACEVACKEWNDLPETAGGDVLELTGMSYDNTGQLGANSWRHVEFIEQSVPDGGELISAVAADDQDGGATRWL